MVFFENIQRVTVVVLHAHRAENRSDRSSCASLLPDHFSHICGGNPEPQNCAFVPLDRFDLHGFGDIH